MGFKVAYKIGLHALLFLMAICIVGLIVVVLLWIYLPWEDQMPDSIFEEENG